MAFDYTNYYELDYIESSGTQRIDTGVKASQNLNVLRIEADMAFSSVPTGSDSHFLFGTGYYASSATSRRTIAVGYRQDNAPEVGYFNGPGAFSTGMVDFAGTTLDAERHIYGIDQVNSVFIYDDQTQEFTTTVNSNLTNNILIFCGRASGSSGATINYYSSAKCYGFKIYSNGTLIKNFVPALSKDGAVGLYDTVDEAFHDNAGSGTFAFGKIKERGSLYIKINGSWVKGVSYIKQNGVWS